MRPWNFPAGCASVLLVSVAACSSSKPVAVKAPADPIAGMATTCVDAATARGDHQEALACLAFADQLKARRDTDGASNKPAPPAAIAASSAAPATQTPPPAAAQAARPLPLMSAVHTLGAVPPVDLAEASAPARDDTPPAAQVNWSALAPINRLTISSTGYGESGTVAVFLSGRIASGDAARFQSELLNLAEQAPNATEAVVFLNSPGGSASEASAIAQIIHRTGLTTAVMGNDQCSAECFIVFAAGKRKLAARPASVGVYGPNDGAKSGAERSTRLERTKSQAMPAAFSRAYAQFGVPASVVGRMATTPPGQVAWLNASELDAMGVEFAPDIN